MFCLKPGDLGGDTLAQVGGKGAAIDFLGVGWCLGQGAGGDVHRQSPIQAPPRRQQKRHAAISLTSAKQRPRSGGSFRG
ncbi:hypothetical protein ACFOOO_14200 [Paracoccus rhizosphaerae]